MGLVNQLAAFSTDTAHAAGPLRDLLRPQNHWCWTSVHQNAFEAMKATLVSPPVLAFFQPGLPTALHTDATRLHGLSYALLQLQDGNWRLIQCGSRFVTDTESRYAVIELEMTAICWAVRKNHLYLAGLKDFDIITDHRPLIPILNQKSLVQIDNPRLLRLREKFTPYHFIAVWKPGKTHCIADALSRAPVDNPTEIRNTPRADGRSPAEVLYDTQSGQRYRCTTQHSLPDGARLLTTATNGLRISVTLPGSAMTQPPDPSLR